MTLGRRAFHGRGLVFTGDAEGNFIALNAATGKALWHFQCGASVYSSPMSFAIDGKQYVAVAAGSALFTFALPELGRGNRGAYYGSRHRLGSRQRLMKLLERSGHYS